MYCFTGGAGYIGSHVAYYFLKQSDCKLVILDDLSTGFIENIMFLQQSFPNRIEFINANFGDKRILEKIFSQYNFKTIVHFAGSLSVFQSVKEPLLYFHNNVVNTLMLLEMMQKFQIHTILFSSTAAVYGEQMGSGTSNITEDSPTNPINAYGESKLIVEKILKHLEIANPSFKSIILRYFNVAGALMDTKGLGQRTIDATHLIKIACECAVGKRQKMQIYGTDYPTHDGTCIRDYIHIDDLAQAHFVSLKTLEETQHSQIYNVGYGRGFSVKEVIDCVKTVSGIDFAVEIGARRAGDPATLISNNKKILQNTPYKPLYDNLKTICESSYLWEKQLTNKIL